MEFELLQPNEPFMDGGEKLDLTIGDFWSFMYSNLWDDIQDEISEFIVSKALGIHKPTNKDGWTLWDIDYRGAKIEVKETADWHCWNTYYTRQTKTSGVFSINKAYSEYKDNTSELKRQSDVYVFCHLQGHDKESSNPMNVANWEFFVIPTIKINEVSGDAKTISLSRVKKLTEPIAYNMLKDKIDYYINQLNLNK